MNGLTSFALALLSGILFAFSLPPYNVAWLAWFALAPFLVSVRRRSGLEANGLGMLVGVVGGVIHAGWHADTGKLLFGYMPFLWLALLFGFVGVVVRKRQDVGGWRWALLVASVGVAGEWLTTWLPLPVNIALTQYTQPAVIQTAAVTGAWGVSFLLWWANAAIADAVMRKSFRTRPLGLAAALVVLNLGLGTWALQDQAGNPAGKLRVAAIQDFSGRETGDLAEPPPQDVDARYRENMTRDVAGKGASLVVWSEESLGSAFLPESEKDPTIKLAKSLKAHLVVGYSDRTEPKPFNCAAIIGPDGTLRGVHHKIHLFLGESGNIRKGSDAGSFPTDIGRVGLEICFDSIYTDVTRRVAGSGAQIVAMPNFDPPTPHGVLHRLHDAMLPFRAVENHIPFVRSDSNGLSQIVDANGRIVGQSPLYKVDELVGEVTLGDGRGTFFTRAGDWLAYVCLAVMMVLTRPRRRTSTAPHTEEGKAESMDEVVAA